MTVATRALPSVSVVVPTYDRPDRLAACLAALGAHDLPDDHVEAVVVDDGTPPPGDAAVRAAVAACPDRLAVRLHRQANAGPASARNAGARLAQGRWLAFTDDDCAPAPDWLARLRSRLEREPEAMVGGRTLNALCGNPFAEASQVLLATLYEQARRAPELAFFASNNLAVERRRFLGLGGFDPSFPTAAAEDRDLGERWRQAGWPLRYAEDAVVRHFHAMGLAGFWRQHVGYGRGARRLAEARAQRAAPPLRIQPPSFYAALLRAPFRHLPPAPAARVAALVGLSQVATAVGYAAEKGAPRAASRQGAGVP